MSIFRSASLGMLALTRSHPAYKICDAENVIHQHFVLIFKTACFR